MIIDREKKISDELAACRKSISRTKNLIDYHKAILKNLESKERALSERLEKEKFSSFYKLLSKQGYDIDALKNAAVNGEFDKLFSDRLNDDQTENVQKILIENISAIEENPEKEKERSNNEDE